MRKLTYFVIITLSTIAFSGCKHDRILTLTVKEPSLRDSAVIEKTAITIKFADDRSKVTYSNYAALQYAKKYAAQNNNSCGVYNYDPARKLSDCAHFIAHCLKAGGITIKSNVPDPAICPDGLSYRVSELTAALKKLSTTYDNVKAIDMNDAIVGDYGFFNVLQYQPSHAFMICSPAASLNDITIYSHTTNRNCEKPQPNWYNFFDVAFRVTDN